MSTDRTEEEKRELRKQTREVEVPGVYRDRGYLLLTLARNSGNINYVDLREGRYSHLSAEMFLQSFTHVPELNPIYLALNILGRVAEGFKCTARVIRRLTAMMTKDELMKMSERALAKEYSRILGLPKPISKISSTPEVREKYVDQMLEKLKEAPPPATEEQPATTAEQPAAAASEASPEAASPSSTPTTGEDDMAKAKAKKGKRKATGAAAKKQETARNVKYDRVPQSVKNPYREGSKKHKAFEIFREGGERASILAKIAKLGTTDSTGASWVNLFRKVK